MPDQENSSSSPWALVCQGGGGKGAWQAGFIYQATQKFHADFKTCLGTSIGAFNCALYLQSLAPACSNILSDVWKSIGVRDILAFPTFRELLRMGIIGPSKLLAIIHKNIRSSDIENICQQQSKYLYVYSTTEGNAYSFCFKTHQPGSLTSHDGFSSLHAALLASASIPYVFPYVQQDTREHRDGGLQKNNPMDIALQTGLDNILVLSPSRREGIIGKRTICEHIDPIHTQIIREAQKVKAELTDRAALEQRTRVGYPAPKVYLVTPSEPIPDLRTLVFTRETSRQLFELGQKDATIFYNRLQAGNKTGHELSDMTLIATDGLAERSLKLFFKFTTTAFQIAALSALFATLFTPKNGAGAIYSPFFAISAGTLLFLFRVSIFFNKKTDFKHTIHRFFLWTAIYSVAAIFLVLSTITLVPWQHGALLYLLVPPITLFLIYVFPAFYLRENKWGRGLFVLFSFPWFYLAITGANYLKGLLFSFIIRPIFLPYFEYGIGTFFSYFFNVFFLSCLLLTYIMIWNKEHIKQPEQLRQY